MSSICNMLVYRRVGWAPPTNTIIPIMRLIDSLRNKRLFHRVVVRHRAHHAKQSEKTKEKRNSCP